MNAEGYMNWTCKQLLDVEDRPTGWYDSDRQYNSVVVIGNRTRHDSGYMCMTILGVWRDGGGLQIERCARGSDDLGWELPPCQSLLIGTAPRTDCLWPSGAMRFWVSPGYYITVGSGLSSITLTVKRLGGES